MNNFENLEEMKRLYNAIPQAEEIDQVIQQAILKGIRRKKANRVRTFTAVACILSFIVCINVFPSFAANLIKLPVISEVAKILSISKGFTLAAENGYIQNIGKFSEDKGIKFTVLNSIFDGKNLIIAYSIESNESFKMLDVGGDFEVKAQDRAPIPDHVLYTGPGFFDLITTNTEFAEKDYISFDGLTWKTTGTIIMEIFAQDKPFPKSVEIICHKFNYNKKAGSVEGNWKVDFILDTEKVSDIKKSFKLNKKLSLNDIKISISSIEFYPTITEISINLNFEKSSNYYFQNLRLENNERKTYALFNTMSVSEIRDRNNYISRTCNGINKYQFESAYFDKFKHLYLKCDGIYKDNTIIVEPFSIKLK
jgi:hypothetical protein